MYTRQPIDTILFEMRKESARLRAAIFGSTLDEFCNQEPGWYLYGCPQRFGKGSSTKACITAGAQDGKAILSVADYERGLHERAYTADERKRIIMPICDRPGANPFVGVVWLGRALNNDIVLDDRQAAISNSHACFRVTDKLTIEDRSSQGTYVREASRIQLPWKQLEPEKPITLQSTQQLQFSQNYPPTDVVDAKGLYHLLRK
ncbi:FHA domain-containing protein [Candidatus Woesearchaeota archaeon]|nr:FHA domain-containing protein [Candidatus Woesearchaeota archaeon]